MKKFLVIFSLVLFSSTLYAQIPEDALKYTWQPVNGTARVWAIGGAMGSLGGDISATFVNPAGLGFFKTSDFVLSPGLSFLKNKGSFRGTGASDKDSWLNLGASGFVGGWKGTGSWASSALSFTVTRTANFRNRIYYTGQNDFSSYGEQYAAEAAGSGMSINDILNSNNISLGTRMALYSYFVDTARLGGNPAPQFVSLAMYDNLKNNGDFLLNQSHTIETSGGITELTVGFAANMDDRIYVGGSVGLPIVTYKKQSLLREEDATGDNTNYFDFSELSETFTTKGFGLNAKLGIIIKPTESIRLGLAVHSPTWYTFQDTYKADMAVNTENYRTTPGTVTVSSNVFTGNQTPKYKYELMTPWRIMLSGAYVLREVEDVKKQKGFLTADIEYVPYQANRFGNAEDYDDNGYYDDVNDAVKDYYKGAVNFRIGGELKFTTFMTRLGFAYYGNPYNDSELKGSKMFISGGIGYRNAGMFIDLTYAHGFQKDVSFPYRLSDKANTFANVKSSGANIMLTVGFKI